MKGVTGPVLITAVVVAVGNGWILAAWTAIYTWTHTGAASTGVTSNGNEPVKSLIGGANVAGLGKSPSNTEAQNIIPGQNSSNPNYS
jgi:hypothetical protein